MESNLFDKFDEYAKKRILFSDTLLNYNAPMPFSRSLPIVQKIGENFLNYIFMAVANETIEYPLNIIYLASGYAFIETYLSLLLKELNVPANFFMCDYIYEEKEDIKKFIQSAIKDKVLFFNELMEIPKYLKRNNLNRKNTYFVTCNFGVQEITLINFIKELAENNNILCWSVWCVKHKKIMIDNSEIKNALLRKGTELINVKNTLICANCNSSKIKYILQENYNYYCSIQCFKK